MNGVGLACFQSLLFLSCIETVHRNIRRVGSSIFWSKQGVCIK